MIHVCVEHGYIQYVNWVKIDTNWVTFGPLRVIENFKIFWKKILFRKSDALGQRSNLIFYNRLLLTVFIQRDFKPFTKFYKEIRIQWIRTYSHVFEKKRHIHGPWLTWNCDVFEVEWKNMAIKTVIYKVEIKWQFVSIENMCDQKRYFKVVKGSSQSLPLRIFSISCLDWFPVSRR